MGLLPRQIPIGLAHALIEHQAARTPPKIPLAPQIGVHGPPARPAKKSGRGLGHLIGHGLGEAAHAYQRAVDWNDRWSNQAVQKGGYKALLALPYEASKETWEQIVRPGLSSSYKLASGQGKTSDLVNVATLFPLNKSFGKPESGGTYGGTAWNRYGRKAYKAKTPGGLQGRNQLTQPLSEMTLVHGTSGLYAEPAVSGPKVGTGNVFGPGHYAAEVGGRSSQYTGVNHKMDFEFPWEKIPHLTVHGGMKNKPAWEQLVDRVEQSPAYTNRAIHGNAQMRVEKAMGEGNPVPYSMDVGQYSKMRPQDRLYKINPEAKLLDLQAPLQHGELEAGRAAALKNLLALSRAGHTYPRAATAAYRDMTAKIDEPGDLSSAIVEAQPRTGAHLQQMLQEAMYNIPSSWAARMYQKTMKDLGYEGSTVWMSGTGREVIAHQPGVLQPRFGGNYELNRMAMRPQYKIPKANLPWRGSAQDRAILEATRLRMPLTERETRPVPGQIRKATDQAAALSAWIEQMRNQKVNRAPNIRVGTPQSEEQLVRFMGRKGRLATNPGSELPVDPHTWGMRPVNEHGVPIEAFAHPPAVQDFVPELIYEDFIHNMQREGVMSRREAHAILQQWLNGVWENKRASAAADARISGKLFPPNYSGAAPRMRGRPQPFLLPGGLEDALRAFFDRQQRYPRG